MKKFSPFEIYIARVLSSFPFIKRSIKFLYRYVNWFIYGKKYDFKVYSRDWSLSFFKGSRSESFFGYYDKHSTSPNHHFFLLNSVDYDTSKPPSKYHEVMGVNHIEVYDAQTQELVTSVTSNAFNFQQGSRALWLDNSRIAFNDYCKENKTYISKVIDVKSGREIIYPVAFNDISVKKDILVSICYERLAQIRPDYGYFCHNEKVMQKRNGNDSELVIYSLESGNIIDSIKLGMFGDIERIEDSKFNHVQINTFGTTFSFMVRYLDVNGSRVDSLYIYDLMTNEYYLIPTGKMVSHLCWVSDSELFGYLSDIDNKPGFYLVNILTRKLTYIKELNGFGDGHPTFDHVSRVVYLDSYPDKAGMQTIYSFSLIERNVQIIAEFKHPLKYFGESRCDLHPRFHSIENKSVISFDTVCEGHRCLATLTKKVS
ncbi:hypothetical protein VH1709_contig00033-0166 [Vibrio harveyi]|uniref:hypothetical protein n=1 Tax=Vibrio harveyi TaxID=669 RepID=UPI000D78340F|nr:hypothetical protein [Vibrio harveyi]GBK99352.1 hypothetical protein VH1709_contig00033-0166 [Vibrio harveyi]